MAERTLVAEVRFETKKGAARRLRSKGRVPAIMYGHREPLLLSIDSKEFSKKFNQISESTIIQLKTESEVYDVLVKDFQMDNKVEILKHIDFFEIERGKLLKTRVLLHYDGNPIGVREGGLLELLIHEVDIECLPKDLPERIKVDIENLQLGQSIHVEDLNLPKDVRVLNADDQVIALVAHPTVEKEETEIEADLIDSEADSEVPEEE